MEEHDNHDDDILNELNEELSSKVTIDKTEVATLKERVSRLEAANANLEIRLKQSEVESSKQVANLQKSLSEGTEENNARTISRQLEEINRWKERIEANDLAARKAIDGYKADHQANIDKITKKYNECKTEKDSMVVRYAQGEAKISQLQASIDKLEMKVKEKEREKELLAEKLRNVKTETTKQNTSRDEKVAEVAALKKELEAQKEANTSNEYRTKWAQNKLKSELDAHKETKAKLDEMTRKFKESKEECLTIRKNCQDMIKTYQESEEIKSNSLDIELKKKEAELQDTNQRVTALTAELESTKSELARKQQEIDLIRKQSSAGESKVEELEQLCKTRGGEINDLNECVKSLREENSQIRTKLQEMNSLKHDLEEKKSECAGLQQRIDAMEQDHQDYKLELDNCKQRDTDMLSLTQRVTERNTELQSENSALNSKLTASENLVSQQKTRIGKLEESLKTHQASLHAEKSSASSEIQTLQASVEEKVRTIDRLKLDLEAHQTEIKTLKKKQASSVKELTREVHTLRRQLEAYESKHNDESSVSSRQQSPGKAGSAPVSLQHSRTNSTSSLDKPDGWVMVDSHRQASPVEAHSIRAQAMSRRTESVEPPAAPSNDSLEPSFLEPDKQKLIEKIVKLQRLHARKNEKLDFCAEHIQQLVEEVQRKSKIIQNYVMREEAGALSSEHMDRNKSTLARKGGIMASINSRHAQDDKMSLDLSLEINHKLQAVLEDTLLKNITLKENIDTLGQEIARMADENMKFKKKANSTT